MARPTVGQWTLLALAIRSQQDSWLQRGVIPNNLDLLLDNSSTSIFVPISSGGCPAGEEATMPDLWILLLWCAPLIVLGATLRWWGAREKRAKRRRY